jgi:hypothetical protein
MALPPLDGIRVIANQLQPIKEAICTRSIIKRSNHKAESVLNTVLDGTGFCRQT